MALANISSNKFVTIHLQTSREKGYLEASIIQSLEDLDLNSVQINMEWSDLLRAVKEIEDQLEKE